MKIATVLITLRYRGLSSPYRVKIQAYVREIDGFTEEFNAAPVIRDLPLLEATVHFN